MDPVGPSQVLGLLVLAWDIYCVWDPNRGPRLCHHTQALALAGHRPRSRFSATLADPHLLLRLQLAWQAIHYDRFLTRQRAARGRC